MNKFLKNLAAVALVVITATSCSDDDSNPNNQNNPGAGHAIEYKLTVASPTVTAISYKNAEGNIISTPESLAGTTTWSKTVNVPDEDFDAYLRFEAESPAGSPTQYSMQIYVDGNLKQSDSGNAIGSSDIEISYDLSNL